MIRRLHGAEARASQQAMTHAQRAWATLIRSREARWEAEIPELATVVIGNGGGEDAFAHDAVTIGFDVARLHAEYGDAATPENARRIDRFFRHEYVHLLQKAWLREHP